MYIVHIQSDNWSVTETVEPVNRGERRGRMGLVDRENGRNVCRGWGQRG